MIKYVIIFALVALGLFLLYFGQSDASPIGEIYKNIEDKARDKYSLGSAGRGISCPDGIIQSISLDFDFENPMNIEEARYILISLVGDTLNEINSSEEIRDQLISHPFTNENINIVLFSSPKRHKQFKQGDYGSFAFHTGKLYYNLVNEDLKVDFYSGHEETFEEALQILEKQGRLPEYFKKHRQ